MLIGVGGINYTLFPSKKIPWGACVVLSKKCVVTSLTSTTETATDHRSIDHFLLSGSGTPGSTYLRWKLRRMSAGLWTPRSVMM